MNKFWTILALLFCLSACSGDNCIDADDFGFANFTVPATYTSAQLNGQTGANEVAPWLDSTYTVTGGPLAILVHGWTPGLDSNDVDDLSAWCAWYGNGTATLSSFCVRLQDCLFVDGDTCTNTKDAQIGNAPCLFRNGVGMYALIADAQTDPNATLATEKNPSGISFHLGDPTVGYSMYDIDPNGNTRQAGGLVYNYQGGSTDQADLAQQSVGNHLYFKILDKFYDDNSGQYRVSIKAGVNDVNPDPITWVTNLVKNFLFGTDNSYGLIRNIYTGVVNNPSYQMAVSAVLALFIMWTALSYLAGNIQLTHTELIVRVVKIAIVSALLNSQYSWTFFNDYLFVWFVGGMGQILQIIIDAGATGPGASSIFGLMIAPQTLAKLFSLLFIDWMGFIYIILFFVALYFVVLVFFDAAVIYLTALITIGLIIIMGPIFICFLLFDITKSLFENWLKQLISYAVQPLILFTGLVFISIILRQEIYGSLGFRVCKVSFPSMSNDGGSVLSDASKSTLGFDVTSLFYWWFPHPMKGEQFTRTTLNIPIPIDHFTVSGNSIINANQGDFCPAYACFGPRYIDLPFLDPVLDTRRLYQFWNGKFVQLDGMLLIFLAIYLLHKFNGLTISIAKFITGTSGNLTNIRSVGDSAKAGIGEGIGRVTSYAKAKFDKTSVGRQIKGMTDSAKATIEDIKQKPSKLIDNARVKGLKKDALSSNPNMQVALEVKKATGMDHKDLKPGAIGDYKNALAKELQKINPDLDSKDAKKIASQLSHKSFKALDNEFAKAKYGKGFKELSDAEKLSIKAITSPNNEQTFKNLRNDYAKAKYKQDFDKLSDKQRMEIKAITDRPINSQSIKTLENEFAKAKYGKEFNQLDEKDKADIKSMSKGKNDGDAIKHLQNEVSKEKYGKDFDNLSDKERLAIKPPPQRPDNQEGIKNLQNELAKEKYGKEFDKLSDKERLAITGKSLKELATDANASRKYQEAYVDAYAKLSEKGVGLLGKRSSAIRSLDELKHKSDTAEQLKEAKRKETGEQLYAGLEGLKYGATGGRFGRSFDDIDTNKDAKNYRMMTHREQMAEEKRSREYDDKTQKQIEVLNKQKGESVISPEFLARAEATKDPKLATYQDLADKQMKEEVRKNLANGEKPALRGDKFMKEYATDQDMKDMISKAEEVKREMIKNDQFAGRAEHYENKLHVAENAIINKRDSLENYFGKKISEQEMPASLEKYNQETKVDPVTGKKEVEVLKKTMEEFNTAHKILDQIEKRQNAIETEVNSHIGKINEHRQNAKMESFTPELKKEGEEGKVGTRSHRTIDNLRRGGK